MGMEVMWWRLYNWLPFRYRNTRNHCSQGSRQSSFLAVVTLLLNSPFSGGFLAPLLSPRLKNRNHTTAVCLLAPFDTEEIGTNDKKQLVVACTEIVLFPFLDVVRRSRRDHAGYPMPMDDEDGLSFGYRLPEDVTAAVRRAFHKAEAVAAGGGGSAAVDALGPFVYHAEGLTFAYVEHQDSERGT